MNRFAFGFIAPLVLAAPLALADAPPLINPVGGAPAQAATGPKLAPANLPTVKIVIPHTTAIYEMVKIPGGKVMVPGAKKSDPMVEVEVKPYWIGRTEVSWDCFDTWAYSLDLSDEQKAKGTEANNRPSKPYGPPDEGWGREGYPAMRMAYEGVILYTKYLSDQTGKKFRLPTEAEWIYAAQGGSGKDPAEGDLDKIAWYKANSGNPMKTHPVATKDPNAYGLYDIWGNVGEFVQMIGEDKVIKGGSYKDPAKNLNSKYRDAWNEDWQTRDPQDPKSKWWMSDGPFAGFRLVADDDPSMQADKK
jgi:formylglycine-generating enzyme required for sulfatase activity